MIINIFGGGVLFSSLPPRSSSALLLPLEDELGHLALELDLVLDAGLGELAVEADLLGPVGQGHVDHPGVVGRLERERETRENLNERYFDLLTRHALAC